MYADIGPISLKQRSNVPDFQLADNRVEYAQLTAHADKDIKLQITNTQVKINSAGKIIIYDCMHLHLGEMESQ